MTIYEALRQTLQAVKDWSNSRFVRTVNSTRPDANGNVNVSGGGGGGSVELDATLTATNKAAQAKAVGDKVSELNRDLSELDLKKMEYKILTFTGSAFTLDGETLTFSQIKDLCLNTADFVYALYANRLYIPQYISNTNLFFEASYIDSDIPQMHRISINSSNQVSQFSFNLAKTTQIPTALPTPNALTFTGGATGTFDGSEPLNINIPTGGGGESAGWVNLIDFTATEEVNGLIFGQGDNGEILSEFKKLAVFVFLTPVVGSTVSNNPRIGFDGDSAFWMNNMYAFPISSPKDGTDGAVSGFAIYEAFNGYGVFNSAAYVSVNGTTARSNIKLQTINIPLMRVNTEDGATFGNTLSEPIATQAQFTNIHFGAYFKCIGIGTRFIVWGWK